MNMNKTDVFLTLALSVIFVILSLTTRQVVIDKRDFAWIGISLIAVGLYAFHVTKHERVSLLLSLGKLELIFLISQLLGFGVYVLKSKAIQHRDTVAWLFFYPYVIIIGALVLVAYPFCFWLFRCLRASN